MWMVEGGDHGKEISKMSADPIFGRKLRPLMPRPISGCGIKSSPFSTMSTPSCCCIHNPNILPWNHPISGVSDYGVKREIIQTTTMPPLVSTRWNPTPEQLQALEEMYRRGTRTPSAEQIQQIAGKLRRFGKIEGKNVFYWFQNHKARERQKKRRQQLELLSGKKIHRVETLEKKQTGLSRRYFEIEHHKKLCQPSNCSTPSEDSVSMNGAVIAECKKDGWTQLHQKELQQKINITANYLKNEQISWKLDLYPGIAITAKTASEKENTKNDDSLDESGIKESQTLQLFPIGSTDLSTFSVTHEEDIIHDVSVSKGTKFTPNEFIEFLPTKK